MSETKTRPTKTFSLKDVKEKNNAKAAYLTIYDNVYDITKFLEEHPGGEEVLLEKAGSDATDAFEDVGHSTDARELMHDYFIGEIQESEKKKHQMPDKITISSPSGSSSGGWTGWLIPLGVAIAAALLYRFIVAPGGTN